MQKIHVVCAVFSLTVSNWTHGNGLTCPASAPAAWGVSDAPLTAVRVLSYPTDQPPEDDGSSSAMAPFRQWPHKDHYYQSWNMNFDAPRYTLKVDCMFSGTERFLRLDASKTKRCVAKLGASTNKLRSFRCD
jgi:hypothetical protein